MIHSMIPSATFAHGEFPEVLTIHRQPCFCVGWDSATRTPNKAPEPTRVIAFSFIHKISGSPSHRSRVAQLFSFSGIETIIAWKHYYR